MRKVRAVFFYATVNILLVLFSVFIPIEAGAFGLSSTYNGNDRIIVSNSRFGPDTCEPNNDGYIIFSESGAFLFSLPCSEVAVDGTLDINKDNYFINIAQPTNFYVAEMSNIAACGTAGWDCYVDYAYDGLRTLFLVNPSTVPTDVGGGGVSGTSITSMGNFSVPGDILISTTRFSGSCDPANQGLNIFDSSRNFLFSLSCSEMENSSFNINKSNFFDDTAEQKTFYVAEMSNISACGSASWDCYVDFAYDRNLFQFTVSPRSVGARSEASNGLTSWRPDVKIISPKIPTVFSTEALLEYFSSDKNDLGSIEEKQALGLPAKPAKIFYTDKVSNWDHSLIPDEKKILIAKDQLKSGQFKWQVSGLLPNLLYRFIVDVKDNIGDIGEAISEYFSYDPVPPKFVIESKYDEQSGEIRLSMTPSKDLQNTPTLYIKQRGLEKKKIDLQNSDNVYTANFSVDTKYDGQAELSVEGKDRAGNIGTEIISGRYISIGPDSLPAPTISLADKGISSVSTSTSSGLRIKSRSDLKVTVKLNGKLFGVFDIPESNERDFDLTGLDKSDAINGLNIVSAFAEDFRGVKSAETVFRLNFNYPPAISVVSPKPNASISQTIDVSVEASDRNKDRLYFTYELKKKPPTSNSSGGWQIISSNDPSRVVVMDSSDFENGEYSLRVIASDGLSETMSQEVPITIRNVLPVVHIDGGKVGYASSDSYNLRGVALMPTDGDDATIQSVEYSTSTLFSWNKIEISKGLSRIPFTLKISSLREGENNLVFRVKDSKGRSSRTAYTIVRDNEAPLPPKITNYSNGYQLTSEEDGNVLLPGLQIKLKGEAESRSKITLDVAGKTYTGDTSLSGTWIIDDITLPKKGSYRVKVTASDLASNSSNSFYDFVYNDPPKIILINPTKSYSATGRTLSLKFGVKSIGEHTYTKISVIMPDDNRSVDFVDKKNIEYQLKLASESGSEGKVDIASGDGLSTSTKTIYLTVDNISPEVRNMTLASNSFSKATKIEASGLAEDSGTFVETVEYCVVGKKEDVCGDSTNKATITRSGVLSKFKIAEDQSLKTGHYLLKVRAKDEAGNVSEWSWLPFVIDSEIPYISNLVVMENNKEVKQVSESLYRGFVGSKFSFSLDFSKPISKLIITYDGREVKMETNDKDKKIFHSEELEFSRGVKDILVKSAVSLKGSQLSDGLIAHIEGVGEGKTFLNNEPAKASINVYIKDLSSNKYTLFESGSSRNSGDDGFYRLYLPKGDYLIRFTVGRYYSDLEKSLSDWDYIHEDIHIEKSNIVSRYIKYLSDKIKLGI